MRYLKLDLSWELEIRIMSWYRCSMRMRAHARACVDRVHVQCKPNVNVVDRYPLRQKAFDFVKPHCFGIIILGNPSRTFFALRVHEVHDLATSHTPDIHEQTTIFQ
jgi:hypothetical protein